MGSEAKGNGSQSKTVGCLKQLKFKNIYSGGQLYY